VKRSRIFLSELKKITALAERPRDALCRQFILIRKFAIYNFLQQVPLTTADVSPSDSHVAITLLCEWLLLMFSLLSLV